MLFWRKKETKENLDSISSTEDKQEVIISLIVLQNQDYDQCFGWEKSIFFTQQFYILSVFNMERYLARPASLALFINQVNHYQQNKQEENIMIKCK